MAGAGEGGSWKTTLRPRRCNTHCVWSADSILLWIMRNPKSARQARHIEAGPQRQDSNFSPGGASGVSAVGAALCGPSAPAPRNIEAHSPQFGVVLVWMSLSPSLHPADFALQCVGRRIPGISPRHLCCWRKFSSLSASLLLLVFIIPVGLRPSSRQLCQPPPHLPPKASHILESRFQQTAIGRAT